MNLLGRKKMEGLLLAAIALSFGSCREDLGVELPPNVQRSEIKALEFNLPITNVYFDSLRTDKEGVLIVGEYADATYGNITGKAFAEFQFKNGELPKTNFQWIDRGSYSDSLADYEFAGVRLILDVDRVLTDDNFINQTLELHTLTDSIFAEGIYLANRTIGESNLIGQGSINIPDLSLINFDSTAKVPVSLTLEQDFATQLYTAFESESLGRPFGFSINATLSNGIVSFDVSSDTTELQILMKGNLYDTLTKAIKKDTLFSVVNFRLSPSSHFSNIQRDKVGSLFESVQEKTEVDLNPDYVYFNELAGVYPKIDLTPFIEFAETEENILINRATFIMEDQAIGSLPTIGVVQYYFSHENGEVNVNWPATFDYPNLFGTVLQTDGTYLGNTNQRSNAFYFREELTETPLTTGYAGFNTVFWQFLYDNSVDDINGIAVEKRPLVRQYLINIDNLIMSNASRLTIGRSLIKKDGVRLKIYYTKPRQ